MYVSRTYVFESAQPGVLRSTKLKQISLFTTLDAQPGQRLFRGCSRSGTLLVSQWVNGHCFKILSCIVRQNPIIVLCHKGMVCAKAMSPWRVQIARIPLNVREKIAVAKLLLHNQGQMIYKIILGRLFQWKAYILEHYQVSGFLI